MLKRGEISTKLFVYILFLIIIGLTFTTAQLGQLGVPGEGAICPEPPKCPAGKTLVIGDLISGGCPVYRCISSTTCSKIYKPVCGVDGITYGNSCEAERKGVGVDYESECKSTRPKCSELSPEECLNYPDCELVESRKQRQRCVEKPQPTVCKIGGCSGELCGEASFIVSVVSPCLYKEEYACYKEFDRCERQTTGKCGWTQTEELINCIRRYQKPVCGNNICEEGEDEIIGQTNSIPPSYIIKCPQDCGKECPQGFVQGCPIVDCIEGYTSVQNPITCCYECKKIAECKTSTDCPRIECIRAPCPKYSCINGQCVIHTCGNGICEEGEKQCLKMCPQCAAGSPPENCQCKEICRNTCPQDCQSVVGKCTDSDGGRDYYVKGTISKGAETYSDLCTGTIDPVTNQVSGSFLREGYCDTDGSIQFDRYLCPNGCKDGACIREAKKPACGNSICEPGEATNCPPCTTQPCHLAPCVLGLCPQDCQKKEIEVKVPSSFSLAEGQTAKVVNYQNIQIKLNQIIVLESSEAAPPPPAVKITVSSPGGCGPNFPPECLGLPGLPQDYTISQGETIDVQGLKIMFLGIKDEGVAAFGISTKPTCGNNICEESEDSVSCPDDCKKCPSMAPSTCPHYECIVGAVSVQNPITCCYECKKIDCTQLSPEECLKYDNCELVESRKQRQRCVDKCLVTECAAPPAGCSYEGGTDERGCPTCGKLVCEPVCGNGICEEGEADYCPPCVNANPPCKVACKVGTCPKDCKSTCGNGICEKGEDEIIGQTNSIPPSYIIKCPQDCHAKEQGFTYAKWQCYDGYSESQGTETSCKPSETWLSYARESCKGRCNKEQSKCGINSFTVSDSC